LSVACATINDPIQPIAARVLHDPELLARARGILLDIAGDVEFVAEEHRGWWSHYLESHSSHFIELLQLVRECGGVQSVLDVGNFPGHFTILLKQLGLDAAGIDLDPERAGELWERHGIRERRADIETDSFPFEPASFDVVVLGEVFEHLGPNAIYALRECRRMLRPGGHLIMSVPNVSIRHRIRFMIGRDYQGDIIEEFRSLETLGHMGHFRLYSHREIARILEYTSFRPRIMRVAGWLPGGKWKFLEFFGPLRERSRSHLYVLAALAADPPGDDHAHPL